MASSAAARKVEEKPAEKSHVTGMVVPHRVQMAEHGRNIHLVTAENGLHPQDFLDPNYWGLVSKNFAPYDHVEVRTDDGTFWAEYLVLACDRTWAKLHPLREVKLPSANVEAVDPEYKIEWKGPHLKHCVIRLADQSAVHQGEQERAGAVKWLEDHLRVTGRSATKAT